MFARSVGLGVLGCVIPLRTPSLKVAARKSKAPPWKTAARLNIPRSCGINSALQLHRSGLSVSGRGSTDLQSLRRHNVADGDVLIASRYGAKRSRAGRPRVPLVFIGQLDSYFFTPWGT